MDVMAKNNDVSELGNSEIQTRQELVSYLFPSRNPDYAFECIHLKICLTVESSDYCIDC